MRGLYPRYKAGELELIFDKLTEQEQTIIKEFKTYCGSSAGERKLGDIQRSLVQFRDIVQKPFNALTLKDIREFLYLLNKSDREVYTKNGIKAHIKRFLRYHFRDWSQRFDELRDFRLQKNGLNEKKINSNTILKKEQIEAILKAEDDLVRKTYFLMLYETGARPSELCLLKWKDIQFNIEGELSEIHVYATKTKKARVLYIQNATHLLKRLKERAEGKTYVFSVIFKGKEKTIAKVTSGRWIKDMGKRIGVDIYPYLLRHTRATELYELAQLNKISNKAVMTFLGHSENMAEVYTHLSKEQVKNITKTIYKTEELTPTKKHELEIEIENLKKEGEAREKKFLEMLQALKEELRKVKAQ
jgi:integrase